MVPLASRDTCQQSSIVTYWYPASRMPVVTIASAMPLIRLSLTSHPNLFQLFHPMGGVSASPLFTGCAGTGPGAAMVAAELATTTAESSVTIEFMGGSYGERTMTSVYCGSTFSKKRPWNCPGRKRGRLRATVCGTPAASSDTSA